MCVQAGADKAVPWTKPEDLPFDPSEPLGGPRSSIAPRVRGAYFDGSVRQLTVDNATLKAPDYACRWRGSRAAEAVAKVAGS